MCVSFDVLPGASFFSSSKSPSCDEGAEGAENGRSHDEIQQAIAEELRSPDRIISQGQSFGSRAPMSHVSSHGGVSFTAQSYHPSGSSRPPTTPSSRTPSPRGPSFREDESPRLPSPPTTPLTYGSRAASPGASQRSRAPSPEIPSQRFKPISYMEMANASEYCEDEEGAPIPQSSQYMHGASHPSVRGSPAPSHPSMRGMPMSEASRASVRGTPASSHPSMREVSQSFRGTPVNSRSAGPGVSAVTFDNRTSAMNYSNMDGAASRMDYSRTKSSSVTAGGPSHFSGVDVGLSGIGLSTAGEDYVDEATSARTLSNERSGMMPGTGCIPGCRTFMREAQNVPTSTPYSTSRDQMRAAPQSPYQRQSPVGSQVPQYHMGHHMMTPDSGYHTQHPPRTPTPNFDHHGAGGPGHMRPSPASTADHSHHHHHHDHGPEGLPERDEKVVAALGHLSQLKKTPSYFRCGVGDDMDFLKVCSAKVKQEGGKTGRVAKIPEIPCLRQEDIDELIKCETADVESAWFLTSDERKTYKKPCPKQQKAQMSVKALVQAHAAQTCSTKEYSPLEHPDPEDISPEVAAAMMFSQEKGIKMEECPNYTITSLFPDEPKPPFPEKIPASSISIVDRSSKDQDEMIEKSATVPSEGVSDSAYTRTMREKGSEDMGAQKSFDVDFAIGQSKREYVLVTQKPQRVNKVQYRGGNSPPWFPGYFSAFPDEEGLKMVSSPSGLFHKAWINSNPANIPTSDVIVLD